MSEEEEDKLSIQLQVAAAKGQDQGKGVARLNVESLKALGLQGGEIIEITGKRTTAAIALPPYQDDAGIDMIRLDGLERMNAGVGIRDRVTVAKADVKAARKVVVGPGPRRHPHRRLRRRLAPHPTRPSAEHR